MRGTSWPRRLAHQGRPFLIHPAGHGPPRVRPPPSQLIEDRFLRQAQNRFIARSDGTPRHRHRCHTPPTPPMPSRSPGRRLWPSERVPGPGRRSRSSSNAVRNAIGSSNSASHGGRPRHSAPGGPQLPRHPAVGCFHRRRDPPAVASQDPRRSPGAVGRGPGPRPRASTAVARRRREGPVRGLCRPLFQPLMVTTPPCHRLRPPPKVRTAAGASLGLPTVRNLDSIYFSPIYIRL